MPFRSAVASSLSAILIALAPLTARGADLATHLFPHKDGEARANTGGNQNAWLEVGRNGSMGWITYQTGGTDLGLTTGSALTLYIDRLYNAGTLKVFALQQALALPEMDVEGNDLVFNDLAPVATVNLGLADKERMLRLDLGNLLAQGAFHGLVLVPANGLRADFGSKDGPLQPLIELKYGFATPAQVTQAIVAGQQAQDAAAAAQWSADDAAGHAGSALQAADAAGLSAGAADQSAQAAAGSATTAGASVLEAQGLVNQAGTYAVSAQGSASAAAGSVASAQNWAGAASVSAGEAAGSASAAAGSAQQAGTFAGTCATAVTDAQAAAAAAIAAAGSGGSLPAGFAFFSTSSTPPSGFVNTGIRVNYETSWGESTPLPIARFQPGSAVRGGKLYVTGGYVETSALNLTQAYDPIAKSWTNLAPLPYSDVHAHSLTEVDGKLYNIGGIFASGAVVGSSHRYDPSTHAWSPIAPIPTAPFNHAAAAVGGKIYVFGGVSSWPGMAPIASTQVYDVATNTWSIKSGMPTFRSVIPATVINGKIHLVGGTLPSGSYTTVHEVYDPATDTWSSAAPLPEARSRHAAIASEGRIHVFGGNAPGATATHVQYDAATNTWMSLSPMATARISPAFGLIDGRVIISGGRNTSTLSSTEEYVLPKTVYLVEKN